MENAVMGFIKKRIDRPFAGKRAVMEGAKFRANSNFSKASVFEGIQKAVDLPVLESWLSAFFNLGSEREKDILVAKARALGSVIEQAKKAASGTYKAASISIVLNGFTGDGDSRKYVEDYDAIFDIGKQLRNSEKSPASIGIEALRSLGKGIVSNLPDTIRDELENAQRAVNDLNHKIGMASNDAVKAVFEKTREKRDAINTSGIYSDYREAALKAKTEFDEAEHAIMHNYDMPFAERKAEVSRLRRELKKKLKALEADYYKAKNELFADVDEEEQAAIEASTAGLKQELESAIALREAVQGKIRDAVIGALLEKSPVSEAETENWLSQSVHVASDAFSRLKRTKSTYESIDDLKRDMMEFYRLVGGKIGKIKVVTKGTSRAHANKHTGEVAVDSNFNKRVLFHELAHHLEFSNPLILMAASEFRKQRTDGSEGEKLVPLRALAHMGYGKDEFAFKDKFFDPYVGKYYRDGSTEVVSMGLQQLASPEAILHLYANDREHLELAVGMAAQDDPAIREWLKVATFAAEAEISEEVRREAFNKELKRVATRVALEQYLVGKRGQNPPYIDSWGRWYVVHLVAWEDKVKRYDFKSIQDARSFLYLCLLQEQGRLTERVIEPIDDLEGMVKGTQKVPYWFTPETKFPKLSE
jgi:hypothetical protein